jgi:hypothetical protein
VRRSPLLSPLLLLPLFLLGACASGGDEPAATPTPTVSVSSSALPTGTPTAGATPTPTTSPSGTPGRQVPARDKDVDGDGEVDAITTSDGLLTVRLSGTGRTVTAVVTTEEPGAAPVVGTADVDRDGRAEVFLRTGQGASTTFVTPYRFDGTTLRVVLLAGEQVQLGIGGSVTHGDGFRCTGDGLLEVSKAETEDGEAYTVAIETYRLRGDELVAVRSSTTAARQGDLAVERAYTASCGTVDAGE